MSNSPSSSHSSSPTRRTTDEKQPNKLLEEDELDIYDEYINITADKEPNDYDEIYLKDLSERTENNTTKDTTSLYSVYEPPVGSSLTQSQTPKLKSLETSKYSIPGDSHGFGAHHPIIAGNQFHRVRSHPNSDAICSDDYGRAGSDSESGSGDHPALHLGNLTWWTTDKQLEDILREFGKVKKLRFYEDKTNGKSRGYAFAEYEDPEIVNVAFAKLQGREINGKQLVVSFASSESFEQLNTHNKGRKERREYQKKNQNFRPFNAGTGRGWQSPQFPFPDRMPLVPQVPPRPPPNFRGRGTFFQVAPRRPIAPPFPPTITAHFNPTFLIHDRDPHHHPTPRDRVGVKRSRSRSREEKPSNQKSLRSKGDDGGRSRDDERDKRSDKRREKRDDEKDKRQKYSDEDVRDSKRQKYTVSEKEKDKRRYTKSTRERR